ncbi:unnamed protein product [Durusdinium trenchii]|uniref:Uncharacterized protein n=1 Tax=Durusdinium trenchii TaxID=1381693 RepID=A0ABP0RHK0_9DINO
MGMVSVHQLFSDELPDEDLALGSVLETRRRQLQRRQRRSLLASFPQHGNLEKQLQDILHCSARICTNILLLRHAEGHSGAGVLREGKSLSEAEGGLVAEGRGLSAVAGHPRKPGSR